MKVIANCGGLNIILKHSPQNTVSFRMGWENITMDINDLEAIIKHIFLISHTYEHSCDHGYATLQTHNLYNDLFVAEHLHVQNIECAYMLNVIIQTAMPPVTGWKELT